MHTVRPLFHDSIRAQNKLLLFNQLYSNQSFKLSLYFHSALHVFWSRLKGTTSTLPSAFLSKL